KACGLYALHDRRTFDRRFKKIPMEKIIYEAGMRFASEAVTDTMKKNHANTVMDLSNYNHP
ncbi:MAG: hypothetical protein KGL95_09415, partial [Patescibacteria group bacterium]|nr:hypothetical protein [Patescibacteria group bacterium]